MFRHRGVDIEPISSFQYYILLPVLWNLKRQVKMRTARPSGSQYWEAGEEGSAQGGRRVGVVLSNLWVSGRAGSEGHVLRVRGDPQAQGGEALALMNIPGRLLGLRERASPWAAGTARPGAGTMQRTSSPGRSALSPPCSQPTAGSGPGRGA